MASIVFVYYVCCLFSSEDFRVSSEDFPVSSKDFRVSRDNFRVKIFVD